MRPYESKDSQVVRWVRKRDALINSWVESGIFRPEETWGRAALQKDKITMVFFCFFCLFFVFFLFLNLRIVYM